MIDPLKIQSLVDGECSEKERREIILLCEQEPSNWRRVGLAFIEEQIFSKTLSVSVATKLASAIEMPKSDEYPSPKQELVTLRPSLTDEAKFNSHFDRSKCGVRSNDKSSSWMPFLAASFAGALLFSTGLLSGTYFRTSETVPPTANDLVSEVPSPDASSKSSLDSPFANAGMAEISLPNANTRFRVGTNDIPLYQADELDPSLAMAKQASEMERIKQEWSAKGFDVDVKPRFISGELDDGRHWVIPVRELGITSNAL